ncbi:MAG: hypothetical protein WBG38_16625, partial [Nodosilinea sp.]
MQGLTKEKPILITCFAAGGALVILTMLVRSGTGIGTPSLPPPPPSAESLDIQTVPVPSPPDSGQVANQD